MFRLGEASELSLTGSQTLAWARTDTSRDTSDAPLGQTRNLVSNLSATWQKSSNGSNTFARLSYSDSRELSGERNDFQLFNFQLSGTLLIDSRRSLTGDLTYQRTWQRSNGLLPGAGGIGLVGQSQSSSSVGGEITYRENDLFGVRRLRFVSRLRLAQDVLKQPGTLLSLPDRETRMWENRIDWAIGRLETQLVLRLSEIDGQRRHSLMVRVQRSFGQ
jgi:hypothetical protein